MPAIINVNQLIVITATSNRYSRLIPYLEETATSEIIISIKEIIKTQRTIFSNLLDFENAKAINKKDKLIIM